MQPLHTVLQSAYSGKCHEPSKKYIEALLALHVKNDASYKISLGYRCWYKFKKTREDHQHNPYDEWRNDIIEYIAAQKRTTEPFIWLTQKEMCEAIGILQSTLNVLLNSSVDYLSPWMNWKEPTSFNLDIIREYFERCDFGFQNRTFFQY